MGELEGGCYKLTLVKVSTPPRDQRLWDDSRAKNFMDTYMPPNNSPYYFPEKPHTRMRLTVIAVVDGILLSVHRLSPHKWLSYFSPPDFESQVMVDSAHTMVNFHSSDIEWWRQPAIPGLQRAFLNPAGQNGLGLGLTYNF